MRTNGQRAARAEIALDVYARAGGGTRLGECDPGELLGDLLTDLRHFADAWGLDYRAAHGVAVSHYDQERAEAGGL